MRRGSHASGVVESRRAVHACGAAPTGRNGDQLIWLEPFCRISTMKSFAKVSVLASVTALMAACSGTPASPGDNSIYTSDPGKTVVVGGDGAVSGGAQSDTGCVTVPGGQCVDAKSCSADERRDVVVDSSGKVVAVVCYPASTTPTVIDAQGNVD